MKCFPAHRRIRRIKGAAMTECLMAMFVLFLVLFGMLQVFYFAAGQFFTDYAALRGARSRAVGFRDYLTARELRVNAIGGSGFLTEPNLSSFSVSSSNYTAGQFTVEKTLIQKYMTGVRWLEYEYWFGRASDPSRRTDTVLHHEIFDQDRFARVRVRFSDYAFPDSALKRIFFGKGIDLKGDASLRDHSQVYLKE